MFVAYHNYTVPVLHNLITGKWDSIDLLDETDLSTSTSSFQPAMGHAIAGAEAINQSLEYDADPRYMPL